jgi:hypothetical protein
LAALKDWQWLQKCAKSVEREEGLRLLRWGFREWHRRFKYQIEFRVFWMQQSIRNQKRAVVAKLKANVNLGLAQEKLVSKALLAREARRYRSVFDVLALNVEVRQKKREDGLKIMIFQQKWELVRAFSAAKQIIDFRRLKDETADRFSNFIRKQRVLKSLKANQSEARVLFKVLTKL